LKIKNIFDNKRLQSFTIDYKRLTTDSAKNRGTPLHRQIETTRSISQFRFTLINFSTFNFYTMIMQNNNVKMVVSLGTNPTVKSALNGKKVARFSVAALENQPEGGKKVKWYTVVSWDTMADMAERCLQKGKRVMLHGHLVTRNWTDRKGIVRTKQEIIATNLVLLRSEKSSAMPKAA
jgi:single-strand DNA-binding protein